MSRFYNPDIDLTGHNDYRYLYSYDALNRLTGADYRYSSSGTESTSFDVNGLSYDAAGNILSLQRRDDAGTLVDDLSYNYGTNNRLSSTSDAAGQIHNWDAFSSSFTYDPNGNMKSQSGKFTDIAYEHRNLPVHFHLDSGAELIANYNAEGQRILKESSGGAWSFYVTEGLQTLAVIDQDGLSHMNLFGTDQFGRIEASNGTISTGNTRRYYLKDHLGSTRMAVGNDGFLKETHDFYPFGLTMPGRSKGEALTREQFTGQLRDNEPGFNLDYFKARYYDPAMGRFLSVDPILDTKTPLNLLNIHEGRHFSNSPYTYTFSNPIIFTDPDGRNPIGIVIKVAVKEMVKRVGQRAAVTGIAAAPGTAATGLAFQGLLLDELDHQIRAETIDVPFGENGSIEVVLDPDLPIFPTDLVETVQDKTRQQRLIDDLNINKNIGKTTGNGGGSGSSNEKVRKILKGLAAAEFFRSIRQAQEINKLEEVEIIDEKTGQGFIKKQ